MDYSIIIPCRNEGSNVECLVQRILPVMPQSSSCELIFVDDSDDDTTQRLEALSRHYACVRFVHRKEKTGLSTAILEGFSLSFGRWLIVMDADLQHPPESLPDLFAAIEAGKADIVIPSRFVSGGSDGGLNFWRKFVSWTARMLAKITLRRIRHIADPTSGYFAVRREVAFSQPLDPIGWKILLELLVRSDYESVIEIPYSFQARDLGSSKFNLHEQWNYIRHLRRLIASSETDFRFWKFCLVGASGVAVNTAVYVPLVHFQVPVSLAFLIATLTAMLSNFIWNNLFTWNHMKSDRLWYRLLKFFLVSISGLIISSLSVYILHDLANWHYLISGFLGILVSTGWNFFFHNIWTFQRRAETAEVQAAAPEQ